MVTDPPAKRYLLDTHRTHAPRETLARVRPFLARMGITRVANVTGLDRIGLPVVMVVRPNSRSVAVSQGKGLSLDAAEASGIMEAVENWHAERVSLPLRYAPYRDIRDDASVVDVAKLPRLRGSRFGESTRILWIAAQNLAEGGEVWVPYETVHTDYTHPAPPGQGCFSCTTNGLASGNHLQEAVCHAICELIERDATTLWHHRTAATRDRTRVSASSVVDAGCRQALDRFDAAGIEVGLWETTSDVGVACFRCIIAEAPGRQGHIGIGDGCHPHRGIALLRALTEAAQTRLTYISGARDDLVPDEFSPEAMARKSDYALAMIGRRGPERSFADCPDMTATSFDGDLAWLLGRLEAAGCPEVLMVDLTREEIGIPVVRAVIPGLEAPHDDDGFVPGARALAMAGRPG